MDDWQFAWIVGKVDEKPSKDIYYNINSDGAVSVEDIGLTY